MTPTAEPTAPASFDAILDSIASTPTTPSTPETQDAPPQEPGDDDVAADAPGINEVEPAEGAEEEVTEPGQAVTPQSELEEGVKPYGNDYRVTKPRMDKFVAANKFQQEIQKFAPTIQDAQEQYLKANDWYEMHMDYQDPEKIGNFVGYWQQQNPNAFAELARQIPDRIKASNPQIYGEIQQKIATNLKNENPALYTDISNRAVQEKVDALYDAWAALDPVTQKAEAEAARYRAQMADHYLNGSHRNEVTRIDPVERQRREWQAKQDQERKTLDDRQRALDQREENTRVQYWKNWEQRIGSDRSSGIAGEIANALKPVENKFTKDQIEAFKDRINNVVTKTMKEDFEWSRNRELDLSGMKRNVLQSLKEGKQLNITPNVKAYLESHKAFARPIIADIARKLIGQTTAKQVADNKDLHTRLASGQRPAANGNKPPTAAFKPAAPTGEPRSFDELFDSIGQGKRR